MTHDIENIYIDILKYKATVWFCKYEEDGGGFTIITTSNRHKNPYSSYYL